MRGCEQFGVLYMKKQYAVILLSLVVCASFGGVGPQKSLAKDGNPDPEYVVAEHLKSIGSPKVLAGIQSRGFSGTAAVKFIQGATGNVPDGQFMLVSEGPRLSIIMRYNDLEYPGEYFAFDGQDVSVGYISPGQRSPLADFVFRYNLIMKEGLLGGTLSSAWPLLHIQERKARLKYSRVKIDGRELHQLEYGIYNSKQDLNVRLNFDLESYRHVRSEYRVQTNNDMSVRPNSAKITDIVPVSRYVLVEKFDGFRDEGGLMLPHSYTLDYSVEGQGSSFVAHWAMIVNQRIYNGNVNPLTFKAQK